MSRWLAAVAVVLGVGCSETKPADASTGLLRVPAGAKPLEPTFAREADTAPGAIGRLIEAGPHGARFAEPVGVQFRRRSSELPPGIAFSELRVATLENDTWLLLPTRFPEPGVVEGLTTHFSTFGLVAPCHVSGFGREFPLAGCETFNPRVLTNRDINLELRAAPVTVLLVIRPTSGAAAVDFAISGLRANWTYFLSRDGSPTLESVVADASGTVRFTQDASGRHTLVLMAQHGSLTLNPTGCATVGTWDAPTRTCTLNQDIPLPPVYFADDGITLDCAGHTVGGSTRESGGVIAFSRSASKVKNCTIRNIDIGIFASGNNFQLENVAIEGDPAFRGTEALLLSESANARLENIRVDHFTYGLLLNALTDLTIQGAVLRTSEYPLSLSGSQRAQLNDIAIDGTLLDEFEPPVGALQFDGALQVTVSGLSTTGAFSGIQNVVASLIDSDVHITNASVSSSLNAVRIDGPGVSVIEGSTFVANTSVFDLRGGTTHIFHNNVLETPGPAVRAAFPVEVSDTRPSSPTYQQGNFWGRACPGPLFIAGADSTSNSIVDSFPFASASAWTAGGIPGCSAPPVVATPVLISCPARQIMST